MMKKYLQSFSLFFLAFFIFACSDSDPKTPDETVIKYFEAINDCNYSKLIKLSSPELLQEMKMEMPRSAFEKECKKEKNDASFFIKINSSNIDADGTTAEVNYNIHEKSGKTSNLLGNNLKRKLILIDGKWLITNNSL